MTEEIPQEAPPEAPPAPQAAPSERPWQAHLDWRVGAILVALVLAGVAAALWWANQPGQVLAEADAPPASVAEEAWPGMSEQDRLRVRPEAISRPVITPSMQATILSGFADTEFNVGPDGRASDIRVVRESAPDIGYGAEARRLVAGAQWPTQWRGRNAPYAGSYRVNFPPGRASREIAPLSIASPNLTPEILALRRNAAVTLLVRIDETGAVEEGLDRAKVGMLMEFGGTQG